MVLTKLDNGAVEVTKDDGSAYVLSSNLYPYKSTNGCTLRNENRINFGVFYVSEVDSIVVDDNTTITVEDIDDLYNGLKQVFFNAGSAALSTTGWGSYKDTLYSSGSPVSIVGGAAYVNLTNNKGITLEDQKPSDIDTFYDGTKITGRQGDSINITLSFAVKPTTNQVTRVTVVPDIGGAVGEIVDYARDVSFSRGQNVVQRYLSSFNAYTYDTWEANGAQMKIKSDQNCEVYDVRYMITRTHKAV